MLDDWRGYILSGFALVWIANFYMSLFALMRQNIKLEKIKNELGEVIVNEKKKNE